MRRGALVLSGLTLLLAPSVSAQDADALFALVDGNHDNLVDRAEADAFSQMRWSAMDRGHTGVVTPAVIASDPLSRLLVGDMMPAAGATLSRDQFLSGRSRRFDAADADGDGSLDPGEFRTYIGGSAPTAQVAAPPFILPSLVSAFAPGLPACEAMARDPRGGLAGVPGVSALVSRRVRTNAKDAAYCQVQFVYDSGRSGTKDGYDDGQRQAITIRIGLPLRPDDGGGPVGWNGRIQNLGSGGCMGVLPGVMVATNGGFAGSSTDGGHGAPWLLFNCGFGVIQAKHRLNEGLIRDFSAEHVRWQTLWTKAVVRAYYGQPARRTYWCGCSQGGREGIIALQTLPAEYDGILAGAGALYWMRFQMAQAWSGVVIKDMLRARGEDLTGVEIARTVGQEIAACDAADGVRDGVIGDPRTCGWSAAKVVCGARGAPPAGQCLDALQAAAFDLVRQGPRNALGKRIWFPWEPGTTFPTETNYLLSDGIMQWAMRDLTFRSDQHLYLDKAALARAGDAGGITYEDMATLATQRASDVADATDPARGASASRSGVKVLAWTGTADRNIFSRDQIKYYRDVAAALRRDIRDPAMLDWYRLFLYPGVDHCQGGAGPQPGNVYDGALFRALVSWVEQGRAPDAILASRMGAGANVVSRPVCAYPKTAIYRGTGSTDAASNFACGGDLETRAVVAADDLAVHKRENGTGVVPVPFATGSARPSTGGSQ